MGRKKDFPLPELPGVCLSCGAHAQLAPRKFVFNHTSTFSNTLMLMSPLIWSIYSRRTAYRPELPICGECSESLRRAKSVSLVGSLLFLPLLAGSVAFAVALEFPFLFLVPLVAAIALYSYRGKLISRGTPKTKRVDRKYFILFVPGYGELTLFERERSPGRGGPRRGAPETLTLNRSVCGGCGFINFAGAAECKKCRAPVGRTAAA